MGFASPSSPWKMFSAICQIWGGGRGPAGRASCVCVCVCVCVSVRARADGGERCTARRDTRAHLQHVVLCHGCNESVFGLAPPKVADLCSVPPVHKQQLGGAILGVLRDRRSRSRGRRGQPRARERMSRHTPHGTRTLARRGAARAACGPTSPGAPTRASSAVSRRQGGSSPSPRITNCQHPGACRRTSSLCSSPMRLTSHTNTRRSADDDAKMCSCAGSHATAGSSGQRAQKGMGRALVGRRAGTGGRVGPSHR